MKVTLLDHTADPEHRIGLSAAACYDSKTEREACIKRAAHCRDSGHLSVLRFAYATFGVEGISRVCSHQLVRVAHAGILQRSQRYVRETHIKCLELEIKRLESPKPMDFLDKGYSEDVLAGLYEAWYALPSCRLMALIGDAIQEIQALRGTHVGEISNDAIGRVL